MTYAFYPRRIDHVLGMITGRFRMGFTFGLKIDGRPWFLKLTKKFAHAKGVARAFWRGVEGLLLLILAPLCIASYYLVVRRGMTRAG